MIAGTAYMIRADLLRELGWGRSLTEDWELTLKLYELGYKVAFTPYAEVPAECVATFGRLARQRMRWAEGHSFNVRRHFWSLLRSPHLGWMEKLEFAYYSSYYLQAVFFLAGTLSWLLSELVFKVHVPEWTALLGWSLLFSNLLSLPLMNVGGLLLEGAPGKDFVGVVGAIALSYLLVPFQAYAALKGLFEKEEGPWFRTPKTGKITDPIAHLRRLQRLRKWLFGNGHGGGNGKRRPAHIQANARPPRRPSRRLGWIVTIAIVCALGGLGVNAVNAPVAEAAGTTLYLHGGTCPTTNGTMDTTLPSSTVKTWTLGTANQTCTWATTTSTSAAQTILATDVLALTFWAEPTKSGNQTAAIDASFGYSSSSTCSSVTTIATQGSFSFTLNGSNTWVQELPPTFSPTSDVTVPAGSFFCLTITVTTANTNVKFGWDNSTEHTMFQSTDTIFIPELGLLLAVFAFLLPVVSRRWRTR
jgi:hypothetical protein